MDIAQKHEKVAESADQRTCDTLAPTGVLGPQIEHSATKTHKISTHRSVGFKHELVIGLKKGNQIDMVVVCTAGERERRHLKSSASSVKNINNAILFISLGEIV